MQNQTHHIGIDCRFWGIEHAGLGRYTKELVMAMVNSQFLDLSVQLTLFFQKDTSFEDKKMLEKIGCKIVEVNIPHYSFREQIQFAKIVDDKKLNLVHYPHFNIPILSNTPFVVTIHDLIKHFFKGKPVTTHNQLVYWAKYGAYRLAVSQAVKKSQKIITPSLFVKDQIVCNYENVDDNKIKVVYEGVSAPYNQKSGVRSQESGASKTLKKYKLIPKSYFIYTGSAYHHKDIPTLLRAIRLINQEKNIGYKTQSVKKKTQSTQDSKKPKDENNYINPNKLKAKSYKLVIACARNSFWQTLKKQIKEMKLTKYVELPGNVPDNDLIELYRSAVAFVTPSLMEGFGLPGLEALASDCPVIAAKAGSMPEIYASAAKYFDAGDEKDLVKKMMEMIEISDNDRMKLTEKGIKRAEEFNWKKAGEETIDLYQKIIMNNLSNPKGC